MAPSGIKDSGGKLVPRSDLRVGTIPGGVVGGKNTTHDVFNFRIGTWNVRTLQRAGKLENLKEEMKKSGLNIIGLSEVRWRDKGEIVSGNYTMFYSGGNSAERGVAIMLENNIVSSVLKVTCHSDRLMCIKLSANPVDLLVIQVYMPTSNHTDEEVEELYDEISDILQQEGRGKVNAIVMGDFNSVVGCGPVKKIVGPFGYGKKNERGKMLINFCERHDLIITNTWFKKRKTKLYTWKNPGDTSRYQIDYILVKQRFRNSVKDVKTMPGADIDSDHNLLVADIETRLKKIWKRGKRKSKWNLDRLQSEREIVKAALEEKFSEANRVNSVEKSAESEWSSFKSVVLDVLGNNIGKVEKKAKKPWITTEMMKKMEERRRYKNTNIEKYKKLNNELRRETDKAKEKYLEEACEEIMELNRKGRYDIMYQKTREMGWMENKGIRTFGIENKEGEVVTDQRKVLNVWEEYIRNLYDQENRPKEIEMESEEMVSDDEKGPTILQSEVERAVHDMRRRKATGDDDIPADVLKELGEDGMKTLTKLVNKIYISGEWPKDLLEVTMIPLKKKKQAMKCSDHRTISLISHVGKIMARILSKRLEHRIEEVMGEDQFGFRKGKGTRDAIGMIRIISEKVLEVNGELCVCFIDWQKAFDRVNWTKLLEILKEIGVDWRDRRLIYNLYMGQRVKVRLEQGETNGVEIGRGVRQGCCMSPILFNLYGEWLVKEALEGLGDFKIGGRRINTAKYADDLSVLAKTEEVLQVMMDKLEKTGKEYGMEINIEKSKVMRISKKQKPLQIKVGGQKLENVEQFKHLGSLVTKDAYCTKEIRARIAMAKAAFTKKTPLFTGKLSLELRKKLVKCYIWSIALYGAETWTLRKADRKYLESFEMWCWRRMEKIKWTEKITNEEVLSRVDEKRTILDTIFQRKKNWIGHILRRNCLLHDVIEGKLEGRRGPGRKRIQILDELKERRKYWELKEEAEDRVGWRKKLRS
jgi:hypothetical protein